MIDFLHIFLTKKKKTKSYFIKKIIVIIDSNNISEIGFKRKDILISDPYFLVDSCYYEFILIAKKKECSQRYSYHCIYGAREDFCCDWDCFERY